MSDLVGQELAGHRVGRRRVGRSAFLGHALLRHAGSMAHPRAGLRRLGRRWPPCTKTVVWILLDDRDAEALRMEVDAGRHRRACGLLLNWAVELITLGADDETTPTCF